MHAAPRPLGSACKLCRPASSIQTTSPGTTSRTRSAPTRSSAHVSEATTQSSPTRPRVSGLIPKGSRKATRVPSAMATTEYAPSNRRIVAATASGNGAGSRARSAAMTSVSELDASRTPAASSSSRSGPGSTRLPLWASAMVRIAPWTTSGCAFAHRAPPVVEYRVWPMATSPGSAASFSSSNTWGTSPISRTAVTRPPSKTAMPADSWPRCCSAKRPK